MTEEELNIFRRELEIWEEKLTKTEAYGRIKILKEVIKRDFINNSGG